MTASGPAVPVAVPLAGSLSLRVTVGTGMVLRACHWQSESQSRREVCAEPWPTAKTVTSLVSHLTFNFLSSQQSSLRLTAYCPRIRGARHARVRVTCKGERPGPGSPVSRGRSPGAGLLTLAIFLLYSLSLPIKFPAFPSGTAGTLRIGMLKRVCSSRESHRASRRAPSRPSQSRQTRHNPGSCGDALGACVARPVRTGRGSPCSEFSGFNSLIGAACSHNFSVTRVAIFGPRRKTASLFGRRAGLHLV